MSVWLAWPKRTPEEAHLFNPAFCGALVFEFVKSYIDASGKPGADIPLPFVALPIFLHKETRRQLPTTVRTSIYTWLQRHPEVLVGYAARATDLAPAIREAILFGFARETFKLTDSGQLAIGAKRASLTPKFLEASTTEVNGIAVAARLVGRLFAAAGSTPTLLSAWRITV
ncbi:MAG: DUF6521 family protein [Maricaulaceae bacterium]|jgi:hypothetical protein